MISHEQYFREVSLASCMPLVELVNKVPNKSRRATMLRQAMMFVIERELGWSDQRIADALGLERSTVTYGRGVFPRRLQDKDELALRCYRIAIRCWVKLAQAERKQRAEMAQFFGELEHARPSIFQRPSPDSGDDHLDWHPRGI